MGSDPHRPRLRPHRNHRRGHARPRTRARRDDGRDDGHRQQPAGQHVALRAAVHDGGGHRERVHRGGGRVVSARVDRDRTRAVSDHDRRQRALAHPHAAGGARMRKFKSNLIVALCGASVLLALVPLAMILFYGISGGFALAIIVIPVVARTTEELLRLVPGGLKEAALALGATRAKAMFSVILPAALPGILTGILVALARVAGETAPLLFTAFNNRFFSTNLAQPIASLTVQVFTYAISPYDDWHRQAWAGAFLLVMIILALSIIARLAVRRL